MATKKKLNHSCLPYSSTFNHNAFYNNLNLNQNLSLQKSECYTSNFFKNGSKLSLLQKDFNNLQLDCKDYKNSSTKKTTYDYNNNALSLRQFYDRCTVDKSDILDVIAYDKMKGNFSKNINKDAITQFKKDLKKKDQIIRAHSKPTVCL